MAKLLARLDVDLEDDSAEEWREWLLHAPPETRYAVSRAPNFTGSVLDADHLAPPEDRRAPDAPISGLLVLVPASPGLLGMRPASDEELVAWFETTRPAVGVDTDYVLDTLERGTVVGFATWGANGPAEIVILGVTGD